MILYYRFQRPLSILRIYELMRVYNILIRYYENYYTYKNKKHFPRLLFLYFDEFKRSHNMVTMVSTETIVQVSMF